MPHVHSKLSKSTALSLLLLGAAVAAHAVAVPIENPSFEADALAPGGIKLTITDWDTSPGGGDGVYRPPASDYPAGIPDGQNVAYTNGPGNRVRQVLTTLLAPDTTYTLKVEVGWNEHDPFAGYVVQLRAGGVVLAEDDSSQSPAQGTFVTSTVQYTAGAGDPHLGDALTVYLTSPGIQANFDDIRLDASPARGVCTETHVLPLYLVDEDDPNGTNTLLAVRNLTGDPVSAGLEYFTVGGVSQITDTLSLDAYETETVSIRDVLGLAVDGDGFARGFVKVVAVGAAGGQPVLAGDFFQVDVGNNFATGDKLVPGADVCAHSSIRFLDFGAGTRFTVYLTNPRGADSGADPYSFTVQAFNEAGNPAGMPQPFWTADHALEIESLDVTGLAFGTLRFDFTHSLGGAVYAEYSAEGRFSVGLTAQCGDPNTCGPDGCCPPGAPKATVGGRHYSIADFPDCEAAIADAVTDLDSFFYVNGCQAAHGGAVPDAVFGVRILSCEVAPPLSPGSVVVAVEVCCPLP
jgi:hypothetical protein